MTDSKELVRLVSVSAARSVEWLRALVSGYPEIEVHLGHQLTAEQMTENER